MWRDFWTRSWLSVLAFGLCACNARPCQSEVEETEPPSPIKVEFKAHFEGDQVRVEYRVDNEGSAPVLVLDRMSEYWSNLALYWRGKPIPHIPNHKRTRAGRLDPDWAYVEMRDERVVIKRHLIVDDAWSDEKEFPCARELASGGQLVDSFVLSYPLREHDIARNTKDNFSPFKIEQVEFRLGWMPMPPFDLGEDGPERHGDDLVWPTKYEWVEQEQQIVRSKPQKVDWEGLAYDR